MSRGFGGKRPAGAGGGGRGRLKGGARRGPGGGERGQAGQGPDGGAGGLGSQPGPGGPGPGGAGASESDLGQAGAGEGDAFTPALADFDVPGEVSRALEGLADGGLLLGRVVRLDRGYPLVACEDGAVRAEHAVALVKGGDERAAVGDWVALRRPEGHEKARIEQILPRLGELSRWDGSARGERQVLAANVDVLIVAQPLSRRPLLADLIARSAVLARQAGARVAVALTKADRSPGPERLGEDMRMASLAAGSGAPVVAVSCARGEGVEGVRALVPPGGTAILLGESGAGKSTLVNALLGAQVLGVGAVRAKDDQGRHTTVARRMLKVPGAGVLIDAPGLRSLPLLDEDRGLALAFPEIAALVPGCRFRDCTHGPEPGCAVRAGVEAGAVDPWRLEEYRALAAEMLEARRGLDPAASSSVTR